MERLKNHSDSAPAHATDTGTMRGFDPEFTDILDYILRITYRIWEGKQVGLCYDYYSDDCPVYTLAGITIGAEEVTQNTLATLASFPDRTLHAENIIWGGNDKQGFHTSHRIKTHMTNLGASEFGMPTGKEATIQVIAHCICKDNKVIEEWLVRDNYSLAEQLGFDPELAALSLAQKPVSARFTDWKQSELDRLQADVKHDRQPFSGKPDKQINDFIRAHLQNIWNARLVGDVHHAYAKNAILHASNKRELTGHSEIINFYTQFLGTLSQLKFSADCINHQPSTKKDGATDLAVRWTISGIHSGSALYGEPTGEQIIILGESHYVVSDQGIEEEWAVFDELNILSQVIRARLAANQSQS